MTGLVRRCVDGLRDPWVRSAWTLVALTVGAFIVFALSWRGVARTIYVPYQISFVVSAGLVAIGLIGAALGALTIHIGRRQDAIERAQFEDVVIDLTELAHEVKVNRRGAAG